MDLQSTSGHSYKPASDQMSTGYTARSNPMMDNFDGLQKFMRKGRGGTHDTASDTSSQEERNFANLLGGFDDDDDDKQVSISNVGHRLYHNGKEMQRRRNEALREEREKTLMKEMSSLAQRPAITSQARDRLPKGHTFHEHSQEWAQRRDEKVFKKMLESRERNESEVTASPNIDPKSLSILEDSGSYVDPVNGWETHYAKYCAKHSQPLPKSMFVPNINSNAVRADADRSIHDRLHNDSIVRTDRLRDAAREQRQRELEDPATGRPYFTPQSLRSPNESYSPNRSGNDLKSVSDRLHSSGKRRGDDSGDQDPEATFQPKINPKSTELAEKVRRPLYTPGKKKTAEEEEKEKSLNRSSRSDSQRVHLDEFFKRTTRCDHVKEERLKQLRQEKEEREGEHCVFQPRINRHSEELFKQAHVYGKPMTTPTSAPEISTHPTAGRLQMESPTAAAPTAGGGGHRSPQTTRTQAAPQLDNYGSTPRSGRKGPAGAQNSGRRVASPNYSQQQAAPSMSQPRVSAIPADHSGLQADEYMSNFEQQMNAVLDEWRRLEEV